MKIESYAFGKITIDGTTYTSDIIIYPDRVNASWWRKEGHLLQVEDLNNVLKEQPDILIIGTGYSGCMKVAEETMEKLSKSEIEVYTEPTKNAAELFNTLQDDKKIIAALHITC